MTRRRRSRPRQRTAERPSPTRAAPSALVCELAHGSSGNHPAVAVLAFPGERPVRVCQPAASAAERWAPEAVVTWLASNSTADGIGSVAVDA